MIKYQLLISVDCEQRREKLLSWLIQGEEENELAFGFNTQLREEHDNGSPPIPQRDPITQPPHYTQGNLEVIDAIMLLGLDPCEANVLKYVARHTMKGGREDLMKAREYINLMLENYDKWYMETPDE